MTVEHEGIGILGHVFTLPQQRRKGAAKGVMAIRWRISDNAPVRALYLGTGYNSHPYYIYHSFGFESVFPKSGFMKYYVDSDFEEHYFSPAPAQPKPIDGTTGPNSQRCQGLLDRMRCEGLTWGVYGPTNFEGPFLGFKHALETEDVYNDAKLLTTSDRAIVGWATVSRDARWMPETAVLDLFSIRSFADDVPTLLSATEFPQSKVQCYVDSSSERRRRF